MRHIYFLLFIGLSLTANAQNCGTVVNDTNAPISFGPPPTPVMATVDVPDDVAITDINVTINLLHSFLGDLNITLQSPLGTQCSLLLANTCGGDDNIVDATFDDDGGTIDCAGGITSGTYAPETPLSVFNGESAAGTWTLTIVDTVVGDDGTFQDFTLEFCTDEVLANEDFTASSISMFPNPASKDLKFSIPSKNTQIVIYDLLGKKVLEARINNQQKTIDVSNLAKGGYMLS